VEGHGSLWKVAKVVYLAVLFALGGAPGLNAQSAAFTYQRRLNDGGKQAASAKNLLCQFLLVAADVRRLKLPHESRVLSLDQSLLTGVLPNSKCFLIV
jgi:hypothetical protein